MKSAKLCLLLSALTLSGCYTTKYQLGPEPNGQVEEADYPGPVKEGDSNVRIMVDGKQINLPPVDMKDYCKGRVSEITVKKKWNGDKIIFACAGATTAKAMDDGEPVADDDQDVKKKKKGKKKKKKKKSGS